MIGGALAKPAEYWPQLFTPGSIWDRFPYLLPNLVSALFVFFGLAVGLLFLEETHQRKKWQRDRGVELGNYLLSLVPVCSARQKKSEEKPLLDAEERLPGYLGTENPPRLPRSTGPVIKETLNLGPGRRKLAADPEKKAPTEIFTRPVILNIISYGILAL
jgi:hypothetical protein